MIQPPQDLSRFTSLLSIVEALRGPEGCPWDKEQSKESLAPFAIEEAFELAEAMESGSTNDQIEELGDLLLQVALQAEVARNEGRFCIDDVLLSINQKMVRRHPHVFANTTAGTSEEVLKNWAQIKAEEKKQKGESESLQTKDFSIPIALPALQRAQKIGSKTKQTKFDWENAEAVLEKLDEEVREFKEAVRQADKNHQEFELGDILFCIAQVARHLQIDAEQALRRTNARFARRYFKMLQLIEKDQLILEKLSDAAKEKYWQSAKKELKDHE